jgi:hypothetical protein
VQQIVRQLPVPGFLETLRFNRLTPLIYHTLAQFPQQEVGEVPLLEELRQDYFAGLRLYQTQERETLHLLEVLSSAGVEVILLKGGDIRRRVYDDPVCRPMSDVDVLIAPAERDQARTALSRKGYTMMSHDLGIRPGFNVRFGWEETYASARSDEFWVDLQWEIQEMGTLYRLPYVSLRAGSAREGRVPAGVGSVSGTPAHPPGCSYFG